jgi:hypothetical protein
MASIDARLNNYIIRYNLRKKVEDSPKELTMSFKSFIAPDEKMYLPKLETNIFNFVRAYHKDCLIEIVDYLCIPKGELSSDYISN